MNSISTGHVDHPFSEGFWLIELTMRDEEVNGGRYLCHARNNRDAFRTGETLKAKTRGALGFSCHRLERDFPAAADAPHPKVGGYAEITDGARWSQLQAGRFDPAQGHSGPTPRLF